MKKQTFSGIIYLIEHEREGCIGCGACAENCPENWEMKDDNKSAPKKKEISEKELGCNMKAAKGCPVKVIHILERNKIRII